MTLAEGLGAVDRHAEAMTVIDETIRLCEANGDLIFMAELLRVKAALLLAACQRRRDKDAEQCLRQSLDWSRRQGALAWELRTAIDYAASSLALAGKGRRPYASCSRSSSSS